jgi:peptide/nickel transport system ATP-binding protein
VLAVDAASFEVREKEVLALVGESGCGKSVTALALTRLLPRNAVISGGVDLSGSRLFDLSPRDLRDVRGRDIAYVFQEPMTSLNPVLTVGSRSVRCSGATSTCAGRRRTGAPPNCSTWSASRCRRDAWGSIRTSSPAACASGS